jgi:general secretion pathway protein D
VSFDAPTNSLLIMATFKDYQSLLKVIRQLDAPRKQVFIEATIMEVMVTKQRDVGVGYHGGGEVGKGNLGVTGFNASSSLNPTALVNNLGGLTAALFGPTGELAQSSLFKSMNINIPSFGAFLQLLQTNSDVNIMSNPHILIMNNSEGEISVGEVLPFPGQTTTALGATAAGGVNYLPFTSVQRQPVELKLKLGPSVNEQNLVRLDVDVEISDVTTKDYNGMGPATSKRATKTTAVLRDQESVVIGGLMSDRLEETATKVPILGDIPVLGFFFRKTSKGMIKRNIIIAITPYVVTDLTDLRRVAEKTMRERREFIERFSVLEDRAKLGGDLDYRRKRGMLEEINRSVREMEKDEALLQRLRLQDSQEDSTPLEPAQIKGKDEEGEDAKSDPQGLEPPKPGATSSAQATLPLKPNE